MCLIDQEPPLLVRKAEAFVAWKVFVRAKDGTLYTPTFNTAVAPGRAHEAQPLGQYDASYRGWHAYTRRNVARAARGVPAGEDYTMVVRKVMLWGTVHFGSEMHPTGRRAACRATWMRVV